MFTPVEAFLGWRYTRAKRRNHFVSFISAIAMLGVALGVAALITIMSIMNGFESELRDRILGMAAHLVITADHAPLRDWERIDAAAVAHKDVLASAPYIRREAMLTHHDSVQGIVARGIEPEREMDVSIIARKLTKGSLAQLQAGEFKIVLGAGLAQMLQARIGSRVTLVAPEPMRTPAGMVPRLRRFEVVGIFEVGVHEYDSSMALLNIRDAAKMFRYGTAVTGVRLSIANPFAAPAIGAALGRQFGRDSGSGAIVTDWTQSNVNLFKALKTEKLVMFTILALTIAVAAFNLVSTLVMVVSEKSAEIAVLQTLGMSRGRILTTFFVHGGLIGGLGIIAGVGAGVGLALHVDQIVSTVEHVFKMKFLSPEIYYISEVPSELRFRDVLFAILVATGLCFCAPIYPAYVASLTAPARALRYD